MINNPSRRRNSSIRPETLRGEFGSIPNTPKVKKRSNRQTSGESASLPQYDEGTESAEVATSGKGEQRIPPEACRLNSYKYCFLPLN
jgi:hypothetical protein